MWFSRRIALPEPVPFSRASRMTRPAPDSNRLTPIPSRCSTPARKSAAFVTSPGGFDVLIRT